MKSPYTKSGKCGNMVWQRNRYGQICYPYYIPCDPRTPAQVEVRKRFKAVVARWHTITEEQGCVWRAAARKQTTHKRLAQSWPMNGYNYFMRVNLNLVHQGLAPVDWPPER